MGVFVMVRNVRIRTDSALEAMHIASPNEEGPNGPEPNEEGEAAKKEEKMEEKKKEEEEEKMEEKNKEEEEEEKGKKKGGRKSGDFSREKKDILGEVVSTREAAITGRGAIE